jgi:hypothetical protein
MKIRTISKLIAIATLGVVLSTARAQEKAADARLALSKTSVAAGIGLSWGGGTLTYKGKDYEVEVKGLSVGDVGVSNIEASGSVYNLKKLEDFDGNYTAASAGLTVGGGASATTMKNQNGVLVEIVSTTKGLKFTLAASGVSMRIKK